MLILPRSLARFWIPIAMAEFVMSATASTPSLSNHLRTMLSPMSGLFWWSADRISIFLPSTLPPISSAAMRAASTDVLPPKSAYNPDWSLMTPILMALGPDQADDEESNAIAA